MLKKKYSGPILAAMVLIGFSLIAAPWIRVALNPQPLPPKVETSLGAKVPN